MLRDAAAQLYDRPARSGHARGAAGHAGARDAGTINSLAESVFGRWQRRLRRAGEAATDAAGYVSNAGGQVVGDFFFTPSEGPLPPEEPDIPIPDFGAGAGGGGAGGAGAGGGGGGGAGRGGARGKGIT